MNEELNTDDFEAWLKKGADKHRMYPSDQLWRNINQQLHGNRRWPALTFGAILTGALVTAALIFLRPDKDLFNLPVITSNKPVVVDPVNNRSNLADQIVVNIKKLQPASKEIIYSFNYPLTGHKETREQPAEILNVLPNNETLALNEPINRNLNNTPAFVNTAKLVKSALVTNLPLATHLQLITTTSAPDIEEPTDESLAQVQPSATSAITDVTEEAEQSNNTALSFITLPKNKKHRWSLELYGGPNINYRHLTEKTPFDYHAPYNATLTSANSSIVSNLVKQKPSVGFNVGAAFVYAISNRLRVKAGLQFNYRQYTIDAFHSNLERSVLLLNNGYLYPDSVYTYSVISNEQGKSAITLSNRFFQLSAPVGVEWTVAKVNKIDFTIASSLQPTYQLNSNVYQITSDYKSYVQAPGLLRRWNVNAGADATANFMAGGLKWQVGPQIRYQMLSSQKNNYSIREHLIDYGVRVGIVKQLR